MAADPLDQVLRLVAEGRLTAEEAAPILAALDEPWTGRPQGHPTGDASAKPGDGPGAGDPGPSGQAPTTLRLEVRENGREVVNVRLPISLGRYAIDRVPGLSGEQVDRVREALSTGLRGPVLTVDDGDSGVRILIE